MQTLSHTTRAYIINADGLPGFVIRLDTVLRDWIDQDLEVKPILSTGMGKNIVFNIMRALW